MMLGDARSGPGMTLGLYVPVVVEDEVEGREGEFCFEEGGEFVLDGAGPAADEDDEPVHYPGDAATRGAGIVAGESLLRPDVFIRFRVDDGKPPTNHVVTVTERK